MWFWDQWLWLIVMIVGLLLAMTELLIGMDAGLDLVFIGSSFIVSVLDGWWIEGHLEGVTGRSIGDGGQVASNPAAEAASLYENMEYLIVPTFCKRPDAFAEIMRSAIAINGSFFNAQRMASQYVKNAYRVVIENGARG